MEAALILSYRRHSRYYRASLLAHGHTLGKLQAIDFIDEVMGCVRDTISRPPCRIKGRRIDQENPPPRFRFIAGRSMFSRRYVRQR